MRCLRRRWGSHHLVVFGWAALAAVPASAQPTSSPEAAAGEEVDDPAGAESGPTSRVLCLDDVDEEGHPRKGVQRRDFLKRYRVELSGIGGFLASDVLSSTYTYGGAATFFPSEDLGLELMVTRSTMRFRLEEPYTAFDGTQRFQPGAAWQALGALVVSPFHAKFKFTEATIVHGDIFLIAGGGRTFHDSVQGLSWQAGLGLKLHVARFLSFRFDLRDWILPQEVLGQGRVTHNIAVMGGFGIWTP